MASGFSGIRNREIEAGRPMRRGLLAPVGGVLIGAVLCFQPDALLPVGWARADLVPLVGQFGVFAGLLGLVLAGAARPIAGAVRFAADWLDREQESAFLMALVGGALVLRFGLVLFFGDPLSSDAFWYHARAIDLLEGRGYVRPGPFVNGAATMIPTAFWPVGFSAFLAAIYGLTTECWVAGLLANAAVSTACVWVLYRVGVLMFDRRVARFGAVAAGLSPVLWPRVLLAEPLLTLLFLVALWMVLARRAGVLATVLAGATLGAAVYVKVNALPFLIVLGFAIAVRTGGLRSALAHTALCSVIVAGVCLPWTLRNLRSLDAFLPTTTSGGVALLMGANNLADGHEPTAYQGPIWDEVLRLRLEAYDEVASDRYAHEAARSWIRAHPWRWAALGPAKVAWMNLAPPWNPPFRLFGSATRPVPAAEIAFKVLCRAAWWLVLIAFASYAVSCVRGLPESWHRGDARTLIPLAAWAVVAVQAFVFVGFGRLRLPVEGLMILAGAYVLLARVDSAKANKFPVVSERVAQ